MRYSLKQLCTHMLFNRKDLYNGCVYKDKDNFDLQKKYCKENLYSAVKENVRYFHNYHTCKIGMFVELDRFLSMPFSKIKEMSENFNSAVVGVFGKEYDNLAPVLIQNENNIYNFLLFPQKIHINEMKTQIYWIFYIYDMSGTKCLYSGKSTEDKFSQEQIKKIKEVCV